MKITIPIPQKLSSNKIYAGIHWKQRMAHKELFLNEIWALQLKPYTGSFPVIISYDFKYKGRQLDSSNGSYMGKLLEDALVECGVLPDDSPKYVKRSVYDTSKGHDSVDIEIISF